MKISEVLFAHDRASRSPQPTRLPSTYAKNSPAPPRPAGTLFDLWNRKPRKGLWISQTVLTVAAIVALCCLSYLVGHYAGTSDYQGWGR